MYRYIYKKFSLLGRREEFHTPPAKNLLLLPPPSSPPSFYSLPTKIQFNPKKIKNVTFSCSHCSCTNFILISCSFETQIMLFLILIDVQYYQNAVFSFEKFLKCQSHSSSGSHHLLKNSPQQCSLLFDTKSEKLLKF